MIVRSCVEKRRVGGARRAYSGEIRVVFWLRQEDYIHRAVGVQFSIYIHLMKGRTLQGLSVIAVIFARGVEVQCLRIST